MPLTNNTTALKNRDKKGLYLLLSCGLIGIIIALTFDNFLIAYIIALIPITTIFILYLLEYPNILLFTIFTINYFIIGINRYISIPGMSVIFDILFILLLTILFIHSALHRNIEWKYANNILTISTTIWALYCLLEIANPSGMFKTWALSRSLIFNGLIITILTSVLFTKYKMIKTFIFLLALFTLLAITKAIIQKFIGFDHYEQIWLKQEGGLTHLIASGTRYFSFYSDAGNFGSNMGFAGIIFCIIPFYINKKVLKFFYFTVGLLAIYAMFLSGTRGAIIVPLSGIILFIIISKNLKAIISGGILLISIYIFFAFTYIGQSNSMIRRMRSSFHPTEDASFNVRLNNQKRLAEYMKNKPFGEGLGLSGGANKKHSVRFTTSIPTDSWYVKIWVETGVIGLIIYIGGLIITVIRCAWIIMFQIKNKKLKGILSALLSGIFGLMVSAYGNQFWGQYPTLIIAFMGLSIIIKGRYFDKELNSSELITNN